MGHPARRVSRGRGREKRPALGGPAVIVFETELVGGNSQVIV